MSPVHLACDILDSTAQADFDALALVLPSAGPLAIGARQNRALFGAQKETISNHSNLSFTDQAGKLVNNPLVVTPIRSCADSIQPPVNSDLEQVHLEQNTSGHTVLSVTVHIPPGTHVHLPHPAPNYLTRDKGFVAGFPDKNLPAALLERFAILMDSTRQKEDHFVSVQQHYCSALDEYNQTEYELKSAQRVHQRIKCEAVARWEEVCMALDRETDRVKELDACLDSMTEFNSDLEDYLVEVTHAIELARAKIAEEERKCKNEELREQLDALNQREHMRKKFSQQEMVLGTWHAATVLGDLSKRVKRETDRMNRSRLSPRSSIHKPQDLDALLPSRFTLLAQVPAKHRFKSLLESACESVESSIE